MASIDSLANEIVREMRRYTNTVVEDVEVAQEEVSDNLVSELETDPTPELTGDYREGWRKKKEGNKTIVHNATDYQLTHLLEKGHAKAGGGRVPAKVHIAPAEERAINDYLERVERAIRQ
ncbi:HK97 gp10 family phage protein [Bacillus sp. DX1.1]|uniref:HK97 gp10 family phage protein n=1 Tax=unclassified Bacillus (in: firmicutes) TaxID=185979 RepID=UPI00257037D7|nr:MULTISPECIES: HK97 gp10 family phage protein [unclassified Bacillus (in: firmicutes)]MDM5155846.1 HK97 gp10 family phage protein [Bacillus sp. DX1.1]WJE80142.1 HK97 gp10 family phage protein [Bacillus sp. DX3.1]